MRGDQCFSAVGTPNQKKKKTIKKKKQATKQIIKKKNQTNKMPPLVVRVESNTQLPFETDRK